MKLLTVEQIREWDKYTISKQKITSIDLMERAAKACVHWILLNLNKRKYYICCGTGNNGGDGLVEDALLRDRLVVTLLQAVDVDREREVRAGLEVELVEPLAHQFGVGAEVDVLLALHQLVDHVVDLRVHQRLAARDRDHGGAALLHRGDRPLDRHPLTQQVRGLLDLAAPVALEVAGEQN